MRKGLTEHGGLSNHQSEALYERFCGAVKNGPQDRASIRSRIEIQKSRELVTLGRNVDIDRDINMQALKALRALCPSEVAL